MTATQPYLPAELIDDIVKTAACAHCALSDRPDPLVLSAIALVSHRFRYHANSRRFSTISVQRKISLAQLHALVNLMTSPTWTEVDGIPHHVTHVQLYLDRRYESFRDNTLPYFDGTVVALLNLIFRGFDIPAVTNTTHTLSLHGEDCFGSTMLLWDGKIAKFGPRIMHALYDLLSNSLLTRVQVHNMAYLPRSVLSSPTVSFLSIDHVRFGGILGNEAGAPPHLVLPKLKELELLFSPATFLDVVSTSSEDVVPALEKVFAFVGHDGDLRALEFFGNKLNTLRLKINFSPIHSRGKRPTAALNYSAFVSLQELCLEYELNTTWRNAHSSPDHPLFLDILNSLPKIFPPSVLIRIVSRETKSHSVHDAIDIIHSRMYHPRLEEILTEKCFSSSIEVFITFQISKPGVYLATPDTFDAEEAVAYARSVFSSLDAVKGLKLDMRVYHGNYYYQVP